jgi:ribonuclease E
MLSFTDKVKNVDVQIPEKVKIYIEKILKKEIKYFEEKFKIKISFLADPQLIIPEYSINLLDKNKKTINKIENINKIELLAEEDQRKTKKSKSLISNKKAKKTISEKTKKNIVTKSKKKSPRILWVRRKKKAA